ncbi:MAG: hypothetical protein H8E42_00345 [Nitrospinae bacterium]|nr:hypothetical protein [Nitrospinota bacterium]
MEALNMGSGLRAVFVNHVHPDSRHVSAMRMKHFAHAFAEQGNKIVLLTETLNPADPAKPLAQVASELQNYDWSQPFILACRPQHAPLLQKARDGKLSTGLRKSVLACSYIFRSGVFSDWRNGASAYLPLLAETFRPQIVWGTFGNTDAWNISRKLSGLSGCPWVADLKDNWEAFMPTGLARLISKRYCGAAHMTTFSESHRHQADRWFPQEKTVIYSGFEENIVPALHKDRQSFDILLTGSIYDEAYLARLIYGLRDWLETSQEAPPREKVNFMYAGNDGEKVARQVGSLKYLCKITINDFMDYGALLSLQQEAWLNVYIRTPKNLFQHKILELLAAERPIISFPGESLEAKKISDQVGGTLFPCESEEDIFQALQEISSSSLRQMDVRRINAYSWQAQAAELTGLFAGLISENKCGGTV